MSAKSVFQIVLVASIALLAVGIGPQVSGTARALPPAEDSASALAGTVAQQPGTGGTTIPYAGRLTDDAGQAVPDGAYDFAFALYDAAEGGSLLWSETQTGVAVRGGAFSARLGSVSPLPAAVQSGAHWLAVGVRGPEETEFTALTPRQALAAPSAGPTSGGACPHDHFGELWEGSNGTYGLAVSNSGTGMGLQVEAVSDGVEVTSAYGSGVFVYSAGSSGVAVAAAGIDGVSVDSAEDNGVYVGVAGDDGVHVYIAGDNPPSPVLSLENSGFEVGGAQGDGLYVGVAGRHGVHVHSADVDGLYVSAAGSNGLAVTSAGTDGVWVGSAGWNGVEVGSAGWKGVYVNSAGSDGVFVYTAGTNPPSPILGDARNGFEVAAAQGNGLYVGATGNDGAQIRSASGNGVNIVAAGNDGVLVQSAGANGVEVDAAGTAVQGTDGVLVYAAGADPPSPILSSAHNGVEVAAAEGNGLYVGATGINGVYVGAARHGVLVNSAQYEGVWVSSAGANGVEVDSAGNYAGYFNGYIYVSGDCIGCLQAVFGRNAGDRALQPGDVVAIQGLQATVLDNAPSLWNVVPAGRGGAVVGVVSGRAELDVAPEGQEPRPGQTGQRLVPRDGAAQPGDYLIIVISGPVQVRAAPDTIGSIQPGTRLTVGTGGLARPLQTVVVNGVMLAESAPFLGVALEAPDQDGRVWVLVNPQ